MAAPSPCSACALADRHSCALGAGEGARCRVFFAIGDWTCSIARFIGTMTGPMLGPDGNEIPPTGKSFEVDFCTVARWDAGQIVEENLFYDLVPSMKQIGLSS